MQDLDKDQTEQVAGGLRIKRPIVKPPVTTLAIGEEGPIMTTMMVGEEDGPIATTMAIGEEGGSGPVTVTTSALGSF